MQRKHKKRKTELQVESDNAINNFWKQSDCLQHIFSFLPPTCVAQTCTLVCSMWKEISLNNHFWSNLCIQKWPDKKNVIEQQRNEKTFKEIYFNNPWWAFRYNNGEINKQIGDVRKEVWKEIEICKWESLSEPQKNQVDAVAISTFTIVRNNMEGIQQKLRALKYPCDPIIFQDSKNPKRMQKIEKMIGYPIPVVFKHFWNIVGEIDMLYCKLNQIENWWQKLTGEGIEEYALCIHGPLPNCVLEYEHHYTFMCFTDREVSGGSFDADFSQLAPIGRKIFGETDQELFRYFQLTQIPHTFEDMAPTLVGMLRQYILGCAGFGNYVARCENKKVRKIIADLKADLIPF